MNSGCGGSCGSTDRATRGQMGEAEINAFLSHLAKEEGVIRAHKRKRLPVVLSVGEARAVLHHLDGAEALVAQLLYGGGLRLIEALRLRIKDVDLEQRCITVRCDKGNKDRRTVLPSSLVDPLKCHMKELQHQHQTDLSAGWGAVELPHALERKYRNAARRARTSKEGTI